jgi:hypothetical protein
MSKFQRLKAQYKAIKLEGYGAIIPILYRGEELVVGVSRCSYRKVSAAGKCLDWLLSMEN